MTLALLAAATVTLSSRLQPIEGFGAASAWSDAAIGYSTPVADFLWDPIKGIGMSIVRADVTENGNALKCAQEDSTNCALATEDTSMLAEQQAVARGALLFGTCWTALPGQKTGGSVVNFPFSGDTDGGALSAGSFSTFATTLKNFCDRALTLGMTCYAISPSNEPDLAGSVGYGSMSWTTANLVNFVKTNLGPTLTTWAQGKGVAPPKIIAAETFDVSTTFTSYSTAFDADATALGYLGAYAWHQYSGTPARPSLSKPVWQTEWADRGAYDATMANALALANNVHAALVTGGSSAYVHWFAEDVSDNNNSGLVGTNGANWANPALSHADWITPIFPKRAYAFGNFSKFIRPGSVLVTSSGAPAGVNLTAYVDARGNPAVVAINTNGTTTSLTVNFAGRVESWPASMDAYVTSATAQSNVIGSAGNLEKQGPVTVTAGSFTFTLAATSVTSFVVPVTPAHRNPHRYVQKAGGF